VFQLRWDLDVTDGGEFGGCDRWRFHLLSSNCYEMHEQNEYHFGEQLWMEWDGWLSRSRYIPL
jgi:hypothetical protein